MCLKWLRSYNYNNTINTDTWKCMDDQLHNGIFNTAAFFCVRLNIKGVIEPTPLLLPISILEDFTKPLSLSFRLFGNIFADEFTVAVLA